MVHNGLDDVVVAETVLSDVNGDAGRLTIRGFALEQLAGQRSFEAVAHLLFEGFLPALPGPDAFARQLGEARRAVWHRVEPLLPALATRPVYDGMRAGAALLDDGTDLASALALLAAPAVLVPAILRLQAGEAPIAPEPGLGHAADVVRMLGKSGGEAALDCYLVTVCDHGLNASTFAARVVASTQAGLASSVLAGMGALKGPLHGGAPGPVLAMLDAIAAAGDAEAWLRAAVDDGERLMGFGHRIYRTRDPRADALKAAVRALPRTAGRVAFAEQVEATALAVLRQHKPGRVLETNVEFYTALLLEAVGFPADAFTAVFAMGRVAGWIAHAREQTLTGRLIRPQSRYVPPASAAA